MMCTFFIFFVISIVIDSTTAIVQEDICQSDVCQNRLSTVQTNEIPIIDVSNFIRGNVIERREVALQIRNACENIGFFLVTGYSEIVNHTTINNAWISTGDFFDLTVEEKLRMSSESQEEYPFGYSQMFGEILAAGKDAESNSSRTPRLPDLKELFSIGPANKSAGFPARRWPRNPHTFQEHISTYYDSLNNLAETILQAFAISLDLPDEFFQPYIERHASALRLLNYPAVYGGEYCSTGHIRASAHTDYGTLTILKSGGPGLQVARDIRPVQWINVPHIEEAFIINLGDLMKRWTNDHWLSTLHQVINPPTCGSWPRRQSIAFFHNLNRDAVVEALPVPEFGSAKYDPVVAGYFLMTKHLAATNSR